MTERRLGGYGMPVEPNTHRMVRNESWPRYPENFAEREPIPVLAHIWWAHGCLRKLCRRSQTVGTPRTCGSCCDHPSMGVTSYGSDRVTSGGRNPRTPRNESRVRSAGAVDVNSVGDRRRPVGCATCRSLAPADSSRLQMVRSATRVEARQDHRTKH